MKRAWKAVLAGLFVAAIALPALPASAVTGTWKQSPAVGTTYRANSLPPINDANTSNWNHKSKGGIPVMFKLESAEGSAVFQSVPTQPASWISFTPTATMTLDDITNLSATYDFTTGNCYGGSLRWQIETAGGTVHVYYGEAPNWTNCDVGEAGDNNGDDMLSFSDLRYDTSQLAGGTFYDSFADAQTLLGDTPITHLRFVVDSYWVSDQILDPPTVNVNGMTYTFDTGGSGSFAPTCDLPDANLYVNKIDGTATGIVNEEPVQQGLTDDGTLFRVVDCKYQYILSIPSLRGQGTYEVGVKIGTNPVLNETAQFDLK